MVSRRGICEAVWFGIDYHHGADYGNIRKREGDMAERILLEFLWIGSVKEKRESGRLRRSSRYAVPIWISVIIKTKSLLCGGIIQKEVAIISQRDDEEEKVRVTGIWRRDRVPVRGCSSQR